MGNSKHQLKHSLTCPSHKHLSLAQLQALSFPKQSLLNKGAVEDQENAANFAITTNSAVETLLPVSTVKDENEDLIDDLFAAGVNFATEITSARALKHDLWAEMQAQIDLGLFVDVPIDTSLQCTGTAPEVTDACQDKET